MVDFMKGCNPSENQSAVLERLRAVTGQNHQNVAGLVIRSILAESKERKISDPARCVLVACSTPEEEEGRWSCDLPKGSALRAIEAARNVVDQYLDQMNFAKNWPPLRGK